MGTAIWLAVALVMAASGTTCIIIGLRMNPKRPATAAIEQPPDPEVTAAVIGRHIDHWQRADMTHFVADVLGYGGSSSHFDALRATPLSHLPAYGRLRDAFLKACDSSGITMPSLLPDSELDRVVAAVARCHDFVGACAYEVGYIASLAVAAQGTLPSVGRIPHDMIVPQSVIAAYTALRNELWPGVDIDQTV